LRTGITTGTCAAAAAKAAVAVLLGEPVPTEVEMSLPSGPTIRVPILGVQRSSDGTAATASVRKDAGDDPDVTHGLEVRATVSWSEGNDVTFAAGEGVGIVTKPGLQIAPGEPAINPGPRRMIADAVRQITARGVRVEIAIPGGRDVAARTFNPRLGIEGGLSILGTTGVVRPYCTRALRDALQCSLDVAAACRVAGLVLVPGNIGGKAARQHFSLADEQLIEVGNEWGFILDRLKSYSFQALLVVGHPGKLAKLAQEQWDTHSARSEQAARYVARLGREILDHAVPESSTCEGVFVSLPAAESKTLANALAARVRSAVGSRIENRHPVGVVLVDMAGRSLGTDGDLSLWRPESPLPLGEGQGEGVSRPRDGDITSSPIHAAALTPCPSPGTDQRLVGKGGQITIVGCGPGSPLYVTEAARQAVARADVLVGSRRLLELFPEGPAERIGVDADIESLLNKMAELRTAGRRMAVLVSGDPGIFSLAQNVVGRFGRDQCDVIPAVSSVQVAFARLGLDWADARILSAHAATPNISEDELRRPDKLAILAGTKDALRWAAEAARLLQSSHAAVLCENLTLPDERVRRFAPEQLAAIDAASLAIVLLIRRSLFS
jgi:cobalt-precorrin-5B (C1)-methyltransferase